VLVEQRRQVLVRLHSQVETVELEAIRTGTTEGAEVHPLELLQEEATVPLTEVEMHQPAVVTVAMVSPEHKATVRVVQHPEAEEVEVSEQVAAQHAMVAMAAMAKSLLLTIIPTVFAWPQQLTTRCRITDAHRTTTGWSLLRSVVFLQPWVLPLATHDWKALK